MPLLALRGLVVFPEMVLHFDVGRKKSIQALNEAMSGDQLIFLVTQRDIKDDEPGENELYSVGVVAKIRQILQLSGDNVRVLVEGLYRPSWRPLSRRSRIMWHISASAWNGECPVRFMCRRFSVNGRAYFEEYASLVQKISPDVMAQRLLGG